MKKFLINLKKNFVVELFILILITIFVISEIFFSKVIKVDNINDITFKKVDASNKMSEYIVVVGKYAEDELTKNTVYQINDSGELIKKYVQKNNNHEFSDGYVYQNQYDEQLYINKVGRVLPNYIWQYDYQLNKFEKKTFNFDDNEIGVISAAHYGTDIFVTTNASHVTNEQGTDMFGIQQSMCSYLENKCVELDPKAFSMYYSGFEFSNKLTLATQYILNENGKYSLKLNWYDLNLDLYNEQIVENDRFMENYAKQFFLDDKIFLLSEKMNNKYAYKIDENLGMVELNVMDNIMNPELILNSDNIIHVKGNEFITTGVSDTSKFLVSLTVNDDKIIVDKIGEDLSSDSNLILSHKTSDTNLIYAFSFHHSSSEEEKQIYIYDVNSLTLVKKIPLHAIGKDEVITFVDEIE